ncbi:hypothetical protein FsymDg_3332 [Candidatus Protofrankia datiscae]|uniref:Secreted protein n=3 Tax=Protofrankia TaxID=2994361 RepID=F8AZY9_9ACTN|nr:MULTISPECIES: DUF6167 family protein [Protofrankia]AEH10636.1 hypothetical protein FsymDg_3332 [Candidatus Protofrankia datiscae]KLL10208.1 hypothetical protein FrCorBMG51_19720 [Protofrankia coriariae]
MPRVFYIALGAAVGVVTVRRAARAVSTLTPQHLAGSLVESVQDFLADVREGMAEREDELRQALGLDDTGPDDTGDARGAGGPPGADAPGIPGARSA